MTPLAPCLTTAWPTRPSDYPVQLRPVREGAPILMTALVTGVGLIPLALGAGEPGKEIQQPMAVVILGGIVTSTFLNMIVIPALYLKYGRAEAHAPALDGCVAKIISERGSASSIFR